MQSSTLVKRTTRTPITQVTVDKSNKDGTNQSDATRRRALKVNRSAFIPVSSDSKIKILLSPISTFKNDSTRCSNNIDDE